MRKLKKHQSNDYPVFLDLEQKAMIDVYGVMRRIDFKNPIYVA